jgi:predicted short-subunit dehydrogenase-like oxidoreductase (DUF2520 family)
MTKSKLPLVSLIGAGKVGSALALTLVTKGYRFVSVINRTGSDAVHLARMLKCKKASTSVTDVAPDSEMIIIAVPDGVLQEIVKQLCSHKNLQFKKLFVVHTSGVHSTEVMKPLKSKGATVASLHPIQTFPQGKPPTQLAASLRGIYYGLEGETQALIKAEQIVKALEGNVITIPKELKPLYHALCVFSSGYLMILLNTIRELSQHLKLKPPWTEIFGPLMTTSMKNIIKQSAAEVLTGPIVRKDFATVKLHLETLSKHTPQFLPLYTVAGIESARLTKNSGRLSQDDFDELLKLFRKFVSSQKRQPKNSEHKPRT